MPNRYFFNMRFIDRHHSHPQAQNYLKRRAMRIAQSGDFLRRWEQDGGLAEAAVHSYGYC
jgi:hypothetical protein